MTADTTPRWIYHIPTDNDEARRQAAARYYNRFVQDPPCPPRVIETLLGVTLCYPLPGDTFAPLPLDVAEGAPRVGVQLEMF